MKLRYFFFSFIVLFLFDFFVHDVIGDTSLPRFIMWKEANQRDTLYTETDYEFVYHKLDRENYYIRLIPLQEDKKCIVTLKAYPNKAKPRPITVAQSIYIPKNGSSPISYNKPSDKSDRDLVFTYEGQREQVLFGEIINISYKNVNTEKVYISYESTDDGYWLELAALHEMKRIKFDKLCQSYIVATPELTTIEYTDDIRFEQIVWTPREDNSWEVRLGATERNCQSEALQRIKKLRTKEYLDNVPVENKNLSR